MFSSLCSVTLSLRIRGMCDGATDCADNSDEDVDMCFGYSCEYSEDAEHMASEDLGRK